jgi:integrase
LGARTGDNPARWKEGLKFLLPSLSRKDKVQHHVALPVVAMPEFYLKLTKFEAVSALALRFTILTASRTGEVIGARWDELEKGDVWIVPAARMKGGKEHRVPLSQHTQELLACLAAIRRDEFVFPGLKRGNPISNMAMLTFLKKSMKVPITTHGFRSSFRDWGHELGKNCDHMEQCLAHRLGDETTEAYLRSTAFAARKKIMNDWAAFLIGVGANPLTPERRAKIVQKASEWSLR